jgi:hypothetical protein
MPTSEKAVVRLILEKPQSLSDLQAFMGTSVVLGMPEHATVGCSHLTLELAAFLHQLVPGVES